MPNPAPLPSNPEYRVCEICEQLFDRNNAAHVAHHAQPEHEPLAVPDDPDMEHGDAMD